ncbi:TPA: NAD-dependent epimerase/dehydratase family protein [Candidatus Micrarchaeota archaeon]|nr:NAD-dependent epimerase/dehydratase family protein [Candidatus Micrarchaeota archaeon]
MDWNGKSVLVTGATGLLGAHVAKKLAQQGAEVVAIVRDDVPKAYFYSEGLDRKVSSVRGGLEDYSLVERAMNEYETEVCLHLGAQAIVTTANRSPLSTFEANIKGTWNVLEAARNSNLLKSLVVASTDKAYGTGSNLPYRETDRLAASHPYDVSKACADMLCSAYFHTYDLPVGVTRCGNIFGEGDLNFSRIVPGTTRSIIMGQRPVIRSDGKMVRDYIYVDDVVDANLALAQAVLEGKCRGDAFNFSYEQPKSVLELVDCIRKAMKSSLEPIVLNQASNEIREQYLSCRKAREKLGWKPKIDFDGGLKRTIGWYEGCLKKARGRFP